MFKRVLSLLIVLTLVCGFVVGCRESGKGLFGPTPNSRDQLKQLGLAIHQYHDRHFRFPAGGTPANGSWEYTSWQVALLPYIGHQNLDSQINRDVPWDAPENQKVFQTEIPQYLMNTETTIKNEGGLAVMHMSGSDAIFPNREWIRISRITDGTSNTLMVGEIGSDFPAWGRPGNTRDPTRGLSGKPGQFGRSDGSGALFLTADGAVRSLSSRIDPQILRDLSTPDGNEVISLNGTTPAGQAPETPSTSQLFFNHYRIPAQSGFAFISPPTYRDEVLTSASVETKHPWLSFSTAVMQSEMERRGAALPRWTALSPTGQLQPAACLFHQYEHSEQNQIGRQQKNIRLELIRTAPSLTIEDVFSSVGQAKLVMIPPGEAAPEFGFSGDLVINRADLSSKNDSQLRRLIESLEDYCGSGPSHLRNLRFRMGADDIIFEPRFSIIVSNQTNDVTLLAPEMQRAYFAMCETLGVPPDRSQSLIPYLDDVSWDLLPVPPSPQEQQMNRQVANSKYVDIQKIFAAQILARRNVRVDFLRTPCKVVECFQVSSKGP